MALFSDEHAAVMRRAIQRAAISQLENSASVLAIIESDDGAMTLNMRTQADRQVPRRYTDTELDEMWEHGKAIRRAREAELEALRATPEYQAKLAALEAAIEAVEPEDQPGWGEW